MTRVLRVGNAQGFWGDSSDAAARLLSQAPDLDYLTLDYLAEVSMSILARQQKQSPSAGYARDFLGVVASVAPFWASGRRFRVVANAGGLNPRGCGTACADILRKAGCRGLKVGVVSGDDVLPALRAAHAAGRGDTFRHLESGAPLSGVIDTLETASAYVGAAPIVEAIDAGADLIVTGRVADPSLTVGPCVAHFGWSFDDYARLAGATVAGHLIECGTQVTGGISTDWLSLDDRDIGFPVVDISSDGSCVVTKPLGSGGRVSEQTVKEQLLYEIGDPAAYLSPDATVSFLTLRVEDRGGDRMSVSGAAGGPPPPSYKVSATCRAGFRASGTLAIFGRDAAEKARRCGARVLQRMRDAGFSPERSLVECLGAGDVVPGVLPAGAAQAGVSAMEVVLRVSVADGRREVVERFSRELTPLITAGPQGVTGYAEGRPEVREVFAYWPTLIGRDEVTPRVEVLEV